MSAETTNGTAALAGARVRVGKNDADVPVGSEGTLVRVHEASGNPIVLLDGPSRRPVALLRSQFEVTAPPPRPDPLAGWERWEKPRGKRARQERPPSVGLAASGLFLNRAAAALLGGARWVDVLLDPAGRRLALRPHPKGAYSLHGKAGRSAQVAAAVLVRDRLRPPEKGQRCAAEWDAEAGALVVSGVPFREGAG